MLSLTVREGREGFPASGADRRRAHGPSGPARAAMPAAALFFTTPEMHPVWVNRGEGVEEASLQAAPTGAAPTARAPARAAYLLQAWG